MSSFLLSSGSFFFKWRNVVFPVVLLALLAASPPRPSFGSWEADRWVDAAGIAVALLGQAIRVLVIGLEYIRRGGKEGKVYADELVVGGIFAHSRNPLYLGNLLVLAGIFLAANAPAATWIGAPFFAFVYAAIIRAEEDYLAREFGVRFEAYRRAVPRLVPRDARFLATARAMEFDWRRVLRKEYGSTFASATILLGLLAWESWIAGGRAGFAAARPALTAAWLSTFAAYTTIRVLKKTGRLRKSAALSAG